MEGGRLLLGTGSRAPACSGVLSGPTFFARASVVFFSLRNPFSGGFVVLLFVARGENVEGCGEFVN